MTISMARLVWRDWRPSPTTTPCRRTSFFFLLILSSSTMLVWPFSPSWTTCMSTHPPFLLLSILVAKDKENHVLSFRFSLQYLYKRTDHVSLKAKKKKLIELMGLFYFLGWSNTITHPYEFLSNRVLVIARVINDFNLDLGWIWIAVFLVGIWLVLLILIQVFGSGGILVGSGGGMVVVTGLWVLCVVVISG